MQLFWQLFCEEGGKEGMILHLEQLFQGANDPNLSHSLFSVLPVNWL